MGVSHVYIMDHVGPQLVQASMCTSCNGRHTGPHWHLLESQQAAIHNTFSGCSEVVLFTLTEPRFLHNAVNAGHNLPPLPVIYMTSPSKSSKNK